MSPNLPLKESIDYAITVTLSANYRRKCKDAESQFIDMMDELINLSKLIKFNYDLIIEFHQDYTIHAHGFININDMSEIKYSHKKDLKRYIHEQFRKHSKVIGNILVKDITNYVCWYDYCIKNLIETNDKLSIIPHLTNEIKNHFEKEIFKLKFKLSAPSIKEIELNKYIK